MAPASSAAPTRRTWNAEEYEQKKKDRTQEARERAKENDERAKKGLPPIRRREELPAPTKTLQARETDLDLRKNENTRFMVDNGRPGFKCTTCKRTFRDSNEYTRHMNSKEHLLRQGQSTEVARSTLEQVRERLEYWRNEMAQRAANGSSKQGYDFEKRLQQIAEEQRREKEMQRKKRREERASKKRGPPDDEPQGRGPTGLDEEAAAMMGMSNFGSSKRR